MLLSLYAFIYVLIFALQDIQNHDHGFTFELR